MKPDNNPPKVEVTLPLPSEFDDAFRFLRCLQDQM
jgi:hypothetical protein